MRRFSATVSAGGRGRVFVPVPFDPDLVWGVKPRHHITGTVNGTRVRGVPLEKVRFRGDLSIHGVHELPVAW